MWSKDTGGKWLHRESLKRMSEITSEAGDMSGGASFQIGDSVSAFTYPLTEGLIIGRTITEEGKLELSIIVAPFKKKGHAWSRASVVSRDAARLSKKMPNHFNFPLKNVEILRLEARNVKSDPAWAFATCVALDRDFCRNRDASIISDSEELEEEESDSKETQKSRIQYYSTPEESVEDKQNLVDSRVEEVVKLKDKNFMSGKKKNGKRVELMSESDSREYRRKKKSANKRRKKKLSKRRKEKSSSDYSDSTSSSSSDSSKSSGEVGEKGKSGRFTCPFSEEDSRGYKNASKQIKGQVAVRKHVRVVLHNLYDEHHTMKSLADALIYQANTSPYKPFSSDTAWLTAYARNIDAILLRSLRGPWSAWNEPVLDEMVIGFLDLIVCVSPNKEFPVYLDDSVRKWMRKKRVGTNPKFEPVSYALQHAKFTEFGPQLFQANWNKQRDRNYGRASTTATPQKNASNSQGGGEKKPPPASSA